MNDRGLHGLARCAATAALGVGFALAAAASAWAQTPLRVGYIKTYAMLPMFQAANMGYFKSRGLNVELVVLNNGPAVASAVESANLDIGYAAISPIIAARARGMDFRFFAGTSYESAPDNVLTYYVASAKSGVTSMKDMAGKTLAVNAAGGGCELGAHDHADAAGVDWSKIKLLTLPFPQTQAALELGNVDAACIVDPFYSSIMNSKKIGARVIARFPVANIGAYRRVLVDGFFAKEGWLKANEKTAAAFVAALNQGARDLQSDPALGRRLLESELKIPPAFAKEVRLVIVTDLALDPDDMRASIEQSTRYGALPKKLTAEDMVFQLGRQ